ncbi:MAG: SRPBCC family protein [Bacteroidetes bacterium]|nr:SRPBCC family protein [Bacteroidota bacterium]
MSEERIKTKVQMGILKPAHEVFEAIVDPDKMNKYFITTSTGRIESGKTLTWSWEDYDVSHEVKVQNVEKDKLISFKWEGSGDECLVVISLEPKGENSTLVKITESDWLADFPGAAKCMGQVEGWTNFLCCLKAYLEYGVNLRVGGVIK